MDEGAVNTDEPLTDARAHEGTSTRPDPGGARVVSLKKREANRRNAQHSTGPRTPEGKEKVRWNALKHGLLAKAIATNLPGIQESKTEFQELLTSLSDDLQPVGMLEELCVERMAVAYWRRRRVIRTEAMELRRAYETAKQEARSAARRDAEAAARSPVAAEEFIREQIGTCDEALRLLRPIKKELNAQRDISDETHTKLYEVADLASSLGLGSEVSFAALELHQVVTAKEQAVKEELISTVVSLYRKVKDTRAEFELKLPAATAKVEAQRNAEPVKPRQTRLTPYKELPQIMAALPDARGSLPRYETMFSREFERAMGQLMKLQQQRTEQGESVPDFAKQTHHAG